MATKIGRTARVATLSIGVAIAASITFAAFFLPPTSSTLYAADPNASSVNTVNSTTEQIYTISSQPPVKGPEFYLGFAGNQTVFIQLGNHPANTSSVLLTPLALQEAEDLHEYCDNNGNLINATNGQVIPFPSPT